MIQFVIFFLTLFFLVYTTFFVYMRTGWNHLEEEVLKKSYIPKTKVSIIIPARNEEENIENLLTDILLQIYPSELMEIIVVDDHSTDTTAEIVSKFLMVKLISLSDFTQGVTINSYKKKAIEIAIKQATGELIITTDADCRMKKYWLLSIVHFFEKERKKLIAAPVIFSDSTNWFQIFQSIDFFTMQGITGALSFFKSGTMCNGANLAYTKSAFNAVKGFEGINDMASGDDMLLMYKIEQKYPKQTAYLKSRDAIVSTKAMKDVKSFFQQRIRWASKSKRFQDKNLLLILISIFLFNSLFVGLAIASFFNIQYFSILLTSLIIKICIELILLVPVSRFFNKRKELWYFSILQLIHIPYIVLSAILSQFGSYEWKNRKVK